MKTQKSDKTDVNRKSIAFLWESVYNSVYNDIIMYFLR